MARRRAGARLGPVAAARGRALPARGAGLRARAGSGDGGGELGPEPLGVSVAAPALAVVGWSEVVLFKTGCGLPPGPGGLLGALEGVSYLVLVAVVGWSVKTKVDTGSGLPAGPFGLLGAVEGFAFLLAAAGVGVAAYSAVANGCAPFCCRPLSRRRTHRRRCFTRAQLPALRSPGQELLRLTAARRELKGTELRVVLLGRAFGLATSFFLSILFYSIRRLADRTDSPAPRRISHVKMHNE